MEAENWRERRPEKMKRLSNPLHQVHFCTQEGEKENSGFFFPQFRPSFLTSYEIVLLTKLIAEALKRYYSGNCL